MTYSIKALTQATPGSGSPNLVLSDGKRRVVFPGNIIAMIKDTSRWTEATWDELRSLSSFGGYVYPIHKISLPYNDSIEIKEAQDIVTFFGNVAHPFKEGVLTQDPTWTRNNNLNEPFLGWRLNLSMSNCDYPVPSLPPRQLTNHTSRGDYKFDYGNTTLDLYIGEPILDACRTIMDAHRYVHRQSEGKLPPLKKRVVLHAKSPQEKMTSLRQDRINDCAERIILGENANYSWVPCTVNDQENIIRPSRLADKFSLQRIILPAGDPISERVLQILEQADTECEMSYVEKEAFPKENICLFIYVPPGTLRRIQEGIAAAHQSESIPSHALGR